MFYMLGNNSNCPIPAKSVVIQDEVVSIKGLPMEIANFASVRTYFKNITVATLIFEIRDSQLLINFESRFILILNLKLNYISVLYSSFSFRTLSTITIFCYKLGEITT